MGPIVVGPGGAFYGPPGSAPDCVWPFCLTSGPPGGETEGGVGSGGGGGRGTFSYQGCSGGDGGGGDEGGEGGIGGGDDQPIPQACPGAKPVKRSESYAYASGRIVKRGEVIVMSKNPLKDALNDFRKDKHGKSLASDALDTAEGILTNKFPEPDQNACFTGLTGHYKLPNDLTIGTNSNHHTFSAGQQIYWEIHWDFDPVKGPHVNGLFGKRPATKFAYRLDFPDFDGEDATETLNNKKRP